jgi:hypothetical protein
MKEGRNGGKEGREERKTERRMERRGKYFPESDPLDLALAIIGCLKDRKSGLEMWLKCDLPNKNKTLSSNPRNKGRKE